MAIEFILNGRQVGFDPGDEKWSLLDVLRGEFGITTAKDGCAPQGQCGCCTVLVDGKARVACVTPARRVSGREVVTLEGLDEDVANDWAEALGAHGGSQCGFCTPGIVMRLEDRRSKLLERQDHSAQRMEGDSASEVCRSLAAHLCRCTGWQGIRDAACAVMSDPNQFVGLGASSSENLGSAESDASQRAQLEGGVRQRVDRNAILGRGGFAADTAPKDALIALCNDDGEWMVAETLAGARAAAARVQGRRSTLEAEPPLGVPPGDWAATLRTSWVEPGYLEVDSAWCEPGGEPSDPLANGGAFGAKLNSPLPQVARRLADSHGRTVLAMWSREDVVRHGPKRPPVAAGMRADGTGQLSMAAIPASFEAVLQAVRMAAPNLEVRPEELPGPDTSASMRATGWAEAFCLAMAAGADSPIGGISGEEVTVELPTGARARVRIDADAATGGTAGVPGVIEVDVHAGDVLDEAVLGSYVIGAVHMAAGWVTAEGLAVNPDGEVQDLTIRSLGILSASELPHVAVRAHGSGSPVAVSDAVFTATAAALWRHHGYEPDWPLGTSVI
ncbi:MAG: 2Fe-2S iron-sulfur cluster-binding protein [Microthrixaceae bacterium]